ncbi:MAG: hypothetical protein J5584_08125 [Clostridia bacterium]|nr:hypothetical protein [Clostridia bacterium]
MNKVFKYTAIIWAILFALFCVIVFVTPAEICGVNRFMLTGFWIGFGLITLAFVLHLLVTFLAVRGGDKKKVFNRIPMIHASVGALALLFIVGLIVMIVPVIPVWLGIILCVAVVAVYAIGVLKAGAAASIVGGIDDKVKQQTAFTRFMTADAQALLNRAKTPEAAAACNKVYEALRYSDPMSNAMLSGLEENIARRFSDLSAAVDAGDNNAVKVISDDVVNMIKDRNNRVKMLK